VTARQGMPVRGWDSSTPCSQSLISVG